MLTSPASRKVAGTPRWMQRRPGLFHAISCAISVGLSAGYVVWQEPPTPGTDLLWISNGVLLAYLLLAPQRRWATYLGMGFAAQWLCTSPINHTWAANVPNIGLNLLEVLTSALLLKKGSRDLPDFTSPRYQLKFFSIAMLAGPALAGLLYAAYEYFANGSHLLANWGIWILADGMGTAVMTPACVEVFRGGLKRTCPRRRTLVYWGFLIAGTLLSFSQSAWPPGALIYPLLVLMLLAMGMAWAAFGALFVTIAGSYLTLSEHPPWAETSGFFNQPAVRLQILVVSAMFTLYSISIVLERQRAAEKSLHEIATLHQLVTENSRDVIILADLEGHRSYVSGVVDTVAGWTPKELVRYNSGELVHPEDRARVLACIARLKAGGQGDLVEYRIRHREGSYVWVESSLKLVQDPLTGKPTGVLTLARDISQRKQAEQELRAAYAAIEALAATDPLTRLANRRRFDQCMTAEWRRGLREQQPLSLLLMDVDFFKSYNDTYGHLRGDSCLKQIAEAARDVVTRPGDLVARFGGEEFAIILPNTRSEGAKVIAQALCEEIRRRELPHSASATGHVTVSVGCATVVPAQNRHALQLIQRADEALYAAKRGGRNQVAVAEKMVETTVQHAC